MGRGEDTSTAAWQRTAITDRVTQLCTILGVSNTPAFVWMPLNTLVRTASDHIAWAWAHSHELGYNIISGVQFYYLTQK